MMTQHVCGRLAKRMTAETYSEAEFAPIAEVRAAVLCHVVR